MSAIETEGVILAAGRSSRTAPDCKLVFRLAGRTMLERSVESMRPFCARIYVVTGAHAETVADILRGREGVLLVHNPDFAAGMYGSVKAGLRRTHADKVFVLPGDCPLVEPGVYAALLAADGEIVLPEWKGRAGHPVLLNRSVIPALLRDEACESLRQFIAAYGSTRVAVDCPGILTDIDTVEAYKIALERLTGGECDETRGGSGRSIRL
ncbi:MAG: nucleotidyltransferase family protein [Clostridiales bacterium]|nr:nucleotidyltransferase family protein [Clostridiales bacterium]